MWGKGFFFDGFLILVLVFLWVFGDVGLFVAVLLGGFL